MNASSLRALETMNEPSVLYCALVGSTGTAKTPALKIIKDCVASLWDEAGTFLSSLGLYKN